MPSLRSRSGPSFSRCASVGALLATFAVSFGACSANKNYEERRRYAEDNPIYPDASLCIDTCRPDPGSRPVDCALAEKGVEFMTPAIWTFEESTTATALYTYSDGSEDFMIPRGYQPPVEQTTRCGESRTNAFHIRGGLFRGWGGGLGTALVNLPGLTTCEQDAPTTACTKPDAEFAATIDASHFDGISFWARRGPGSQAEIRVLAGDKYTDDDLNVASYKYCKIVRLCDCENHKPCTAYEVQSGLGNPETCHRCFDPEVDRDPPADCLPVSGSVMGDQAGQNLYDLCDVDRCEEPHPTGASAPLINDRACTPYTFQTGETRDVCYNKGEDPNPAESHETCGDHWTSTVVLGLDWQFYMVPFSAMRQQGFAKEAPRLLTDELSVIRFTWDGGWIDYWIDDVRFYRLER